MTSLVRVGEILAGKYQVERVLGAGGMGVVIAARHLQLEERVAIKLLQPNAQEDPGVTARFLREAKAAARIRSEHIARVFDVGTLESGAPGERFPNVAELAAARALWTAPESTGAPERPTTATSSAAATNTPAKTPASTPTKTTAPDPKTLFGKRK